MLEASWNVVLALAPWILLGTVIASLLHGLLPQGFVTRQLKGPSGVIKGVLLGVPLPLCSCGVIPAAIGLKKDGAPDGASMGFLISTPQTGVDSVFVSASFLGWPFAIFKVATALVSGIVGGLLVGWKQDTKTPHQPIDVLVPNPSNPRTFKEMTQHGLDVIASIWHWLVIGILISALIHLQIGTDSLPNLNEYGIWPAMLLALLASTPLYICATASVPVAAALVAAQVIPPGAAMVFLMAGPATNVATLGAVYGNYGLRSLAIYLGIIISFSLVAGALFNELLSTELIAQTTPEHHSQWWTIVCGILFLALLAYFSLERSYQWIRSKRRSQGDSITMKVTGMTCMGCVKKLRNKLGAINTVERADIELSEGLVTIYGNTPREEVKEAIKAAGFDSE